MDRLVELLTVADRFKLERIGLVVVPDFAPPAGWKACSESVVIVAPDGQMYELTARLEVWHFNIRDPAGADRRWRLVVSFPAASQQDVPVGSKVMVARSLKAAIEAAEVAG